MPRTLPAASCGANWKLLGSLTSMPKFSAGTLRLSRKSHEKPFTFGASNCTVARIGSFRFEFELPAMKSAFTVSLNLWLPDSTCWRNLVV